MITGVQFVSIAFSLLMLYVTFLHFKKKELNISEAGFFFLVWSVAIVITIIPKSADFILSTFRIYRLLDLVTILGFMLVTVISFKNYLEIKDLKKKIEKITRTLALSEKK